MLHLVQGHVHGQRSQTGSAKDKVRDIFQNAIWQQTELEDAKGDQTLERLHPSLQECNLIALDAGRFQAQLEQRDSSVPAYRGQGQKALILILFSREVIISGDFKPESAVMNFSAGPETLICN